MTFNGVMAVLHCVISLHLVNLPSNTKPLPRALNLLIKIRPVAEFTRESIVFCNMGPTCTIIGGDSRTAGAARAAL